MSSIWYERVWAKRDGRWIFLSHRTVHGPSLAPAGVDPTLGTPDTKVWYLTDPAPAAVAKSQDEAELLKIDQKLAGFFTKGDTRSVAKRHLEPISSWSTTRDGRAARSRCRSTHKRRCCSA